MNNKIINKENLDKIIVNIKNNNKKIALCHGVFDVLHVGHKRHLEFGKKCADILIVSLTSDKYVGKGPGRPIFSNELRIEMVSSLEFVDYVVLSEYPSSENIIKSIKPDFYVKGDEYSDHKNDITNKIEVETSLVEKFGGKIVFSNEITYSSSSISNKIFNQLPKNTQHYLKKVNFNNFEENLNKEIDKIENLNILVIGDTIIDEYIYVSPLSKPSKENIISTLYQYQEEYLGGVIASANLASNFTKKINLLSLIGDEKKIKTFINEKVDVNINQIFFKSDKFITVKKSRIVDPNFLKKLFEISYFKAGELDVKVKSDINKWLKRNISQFDAVIVNDFGHGLIDVKTAKIISQEAKFLCLNSQTNSANRGFNLITKYEKADFICLDLPEARLASMMQYEDIDQIVNKLRDRIIFNDIIITNGKHGAIGYDQNLKKHSWPAFNHKAIDTMGAGDAFFCMSSLLIASGCKLEYAGFIANAIAALYVDIVGNSRQPSKVELKKFITRMLK